MFAIMTRFRGRIPTINFDEGSSIPLRFILELANKLTPSHVMDRFGKFVVFDHILDSQTFHTNHLVFVDYSCREFVLVVSSTIVDTSVNTGNLSACFLPVLGTFFLRGQPTLGFCQSLLIFCVELRVSNCLTCGENDHRFETQVEPNFRETTRKRFDLLLKEHGDKIAIGTVLGDGNRTGLRVFGQFSMEDDRKRLVHFGKCELTILPREGIGGISCRLSVSSLFESGILGSSRVKVLVGTVQMTQRLLDGNRGDIREPGVLFLQSGKHGRKIVIGQLLPMLEIGGFTGRKAPVIHKAATSECLRKDTLLFVSRVEPILVCPLCFAHCFLPFTNKGNKGSNSSKPVRLSTSGAISHNLTT
jgi:hypothetical protein